MKHFRIELLLFILGFLAFIRPGEDPVEKMVTSLQHWAENNPQEKVYLHTDKPYYVVGDTIWFKAYVTIGAHHNLSAKSGAVYVELVNEADSLTESLKLPLMAGMAKGSIVLSDSIAKEGNYRIRAYTQWMRNAGSDYFYDKVFTVANSSINNLYAEIDCAYRKEGKESVLMATLKYTDKNGKPYLNKMVKYNLREEFNTVLRGSGITDENGELKVTFKKFSIRNLRASHLATQIELDDKEVALKTFPIKLMYEDVDLQFFPEGGTLLNGVKNRLAFKATGVDGLGVDIKGVVTDNSGLKVAEFSSQHLGMGYFTYVPLAGKTYEAKVVYPDGQSNTMKLPVAVDLGYGLAVYGNIAGDSVVVHVNASPAAVAQSSQHIALIVQSGGSVQYVRDISVNKPATVLPISSKEFPSGIVQFTLLSMTGVPLNERIVFVQNNDRMDVVVSGERKVYGKREKVTLNVETKDTSGEPLVANLSVSVINENLVPVKEADEHTIFSQLLLSSDIKGYIEKPNYYFHEPNVKTRADLDVLMLTQGYRRFVWQDLFSGRPAQNIFKAESLATEVSGKLFDLWGKPITNGKVSLMNNKLGLYLDTLTDQNGGFNFDKLVIADGVRFSVQGRKPNKGKRVEVVLDKVPLQQQTQNQNVGDVSTNIRETMMVAIDNNAKYEDELQKNGYAYYFNVLREVKIKATKRNVGSLSRLREQVEQTVMFKMEDDCKAVLFCLKKKLKDINFRTLETEHGNIFFSPSLNKRTMGIFINGVNYPDSMCADVFLMHPSEIIRVDVIRSEKGTYPSLLIYTRNPFVSGRYNPSIATYSPKGFNGAKEFYLPKYNGPGNNMDLDLRKTVYWNPVVVTQDGKASFDFFNGDAKGTYRVVVEGINADGLLGRQVYRYIIN